MFRTFRRREAKSCDSWRMLRVWTPIFSPVANVDTSHNVSGMKDRLTRKIHTGFCHQYRYSRKSVLSAAGKDLASRFDQSSSDQPQSSINQYSLCLFPWPAATLLSALHQVDQYLLFRRMSEPTTA